MRRTITANDDLRREEIVTNETDNILANQICERRYNLILIISSTIIYLASMIYGIVMLNNPDFSSSQARIMIMQSVGGIAIPFGLYLLEKIAKMKISFPIKFSIVLFAFMGIILGEDFEFYYRIQYWDKFLHATSGFGITFIGYCFAANYLKSNDTIKHKRAVAVVFSLLVSFSIAMLWEIYEFSFDTIAGTNMQKFMPENNLFNGGNTAATLNGTQEQIYEFYKNPDGYRFALMDTMGDMIACFIGSNVFIIISWIINSCAKKEMFSSYVELNLNSNKKETVIQE